ncbi:MAG: hypothetical protein D6812_17630 [Deltaproteobacteria bacterium]|nr:MAG: hypothetical protein D6812_17630 [Deltaproteobacteria bacterium]
MRRWVSVFVGFLLAGGVVACDRPVKNPASVDVSGRWIFQQVHLTFSPECGQALAAVTGAQSFEIVVANDEAHPYLFEGEGEPFPFGTEELQLRVAGEVIEAKVSFSRFEFRTFGNTFPAPLDAVDALPVSETTIPPISFTAKGTSPDFPECLLIAKIPPIVIEKETTGGTEGSVATVSATMSPTGETTGSSPETTGQTGGERSRE